MTLTHTIVTGSGGLVGAALVEALEGTTIVHCASTSREDAMARVFRWSPEDTSLNLPEVEIDAVVHLAGESIAAQRWTAAHKRRIRDSRVHGTSLWARTLAEQASKPRVLVCASAVGFYGPTGARVVTESDPSGEGFLAEVCEAWEEAAEPARAAGIRVVHLRFGVILSSDGGALAKMLPAFKLGLGGVVGSGDQGFPWVSLRDARRAIEFALSQDTLSGPVNVVSPGLVDNASFTKTLGRALRRPTAIPLPGFLARVGLGREMANELLLTGQRASPRALLDAGFEFQDADLEEALPRIVA